MRPWRPARVLAMTIAAAAIAGLLAACAHTVAGDAPAEARLASAPLALPEMVDARGRFREIYCAVAADHGAALPEHRPCEQALARLAEEPRPTGRPVALGPRRVDFTTVIVPGLLGECLRSDLDPYADSIGHVERLGYPARVVRVGGRSGSGLNARQLAAALGAPPLAQARKLVLIGHSKGAVDILEAVAAFAELRRRVAAIVSVAGPIAGSPLADREDRWYVKLVENFPSFSCPRSDQAGVRSVSTIVRREALETIARPRGVRTFSLGAVPLGEDDVSTLLRPFYDELSVHDRRNDGNVIYRDAVIPGSVLMGYVRADHFAVAVPFSRRRPVLAATLIDRNAFPREVLLESILRFVEERLGEP